MRSRGQRPLGQPSPDRHIASFESTTDELSLRFDVSGPREEKIRLAVMLATSMRLRTGSA